MMPIHWIAPVVAPAVVLWQESGENPALFCYLIGWGTYLNLRCRAMAPIPETERHEATCSNPSESFSTTYLMSKG